MRRQDRAAGVRAGEDRRLGQRLGQRGRRRLGGRAQHAGPGRAAGGRVEQVVRRARPRVPPDALVDARRGDRVVVELDHLGEHAGDRVGDQHLVRRRARAGRRRGRRRTGRAARAARPRGRRPGPWRCRRGRGGRRAAARRCRPRRRRGRAASRPRGEGAAGARLGGGGERLVQVGARMADERAGVAGAHHGAEQRRVGEPAGGGRAGDRRADGVAQRPRGGHGLARVGVERAQLAVRVEAREPRLEVLDQAAGLVERRAGAAEQPDGRAHGGERELGERS